MKKLISNFTVILTFSAILLASCEKKTVPQTARKEAPSPADVTSPVENTQTDTSSPVETAQPQPATYGEKPRPDSAGDIVFADGTATAWHEGLSLSEEQKQAAVAVIFYDGEAKLLGVGLAHNRDGLALWTTEANAYNENITTLKFEEVKDCDGIFLIGDSDGSENLAKIRAYLLELGKDDDTADSEKYPAFHYVKNYASDERSRVYGTPFADGWYLPTIAELSYLWKNHESVTAASSLCGGDGFDEFGEGIYWSSSLFDNVRLAYVFVFKNGDWDYTHVSGFNKMCTLAIRDFTMK